MGHQFDMYLLEKEQEQFPNPEPILDICAKFGLEPSDVLVLARHAPAMKAAKYVLLRVW